MTQLPLPIDWRSSGQHSAIIVGDGNRDAVELLSRPDLWPSHCTLLVGPPRSGRSIIAAGIAAQGLADVIDDADRQDEATLFHRWNGAREVGRRLILVAADAPPRWAIALPDLRSRLSAAGVARIAAPDEAMVEAMIAQGLSESGTAFAPDVPRYLAPRLPRCYQSVEAAVTALTGDSLSSARKISLPRAKQVLEGQMLEGVPLLTPD
ncbi:chromosomal replication initiator DnaA [Sphingobium sufflavum]|uniref:DnaA ATPase domain-containing protein n=1 Tax=Sphingobium sufflavum TaxID=1129547 RepID=UPI001F3BEF0E|nr:DnaA/Hda family protein [Sphingobium sufflavum]MCE7797425.1 chromosomal replication initiator DnaA [Sphingobium sufflavum]